MIDPVDQNPAPHRLVMGNRAYWSLPNLPYLGVELRLDAGIVASLLLDMPGVIERKPMAISITQADDSIMEPLDRLLRLLDAPGEIPVLARQFERELCYRLPPTMQAYLNGRATSHQVINHGCP